MQQIRGLNVGALSQQQPQEKAQGIPSHWRTYFAVKSADETAKKAKQAGGKVLMEPFDVMDAGRMTMIQDPQGAIFGIWQAKAHTGFQVVREPGAVTWSEVITTDPKGASAFYSKTLGVSASEVPGMDYTMMRAGGQDAAGAMKIKPEMGPVPPHWMVYFAVADVNTTVKKAQSLGGKVLMPKQDIPGQGSFAVLQDPQGAVFAVFKSSRPS
jgi:predicted enzyme related to lactoylglutathione lyase